MKSLVVIFIVLIVGIVFIAVWDSSSSSTNDETNYNEISWRFPLKKEMEIVDNTFFQSEIKLCPRYYIKKFVGEKYLIACEEGDGDWSYYTVYASQRKVHRTSQQIVDSFIPPPLKPVQPLDDLAKSSPKEKVKPAVNKSGSETK